MNDLPTLNIREAIDEITLAVAGPVEETELAIEIVDKALEYLFHVRGNLSGLDEQEIERIVQAIVKGVLKRLMQIAEGGGQIGRA
jgi:hypothetical protein